MTRHPVVRTLLDVGGAVTDLTTSIVDPSAPGLGVWDIRGLAGHLLRAFRTPSAYLDRPSAEDIEHSDAAAYFVAYLERRDSAPAPTDDEVADRGSAELPGADALGITAAYRDSLASLESKLDAAPADFIVPSPFGAIALPDYLETRVFEATVHGLDLANALDMSQWRTPPDAMRMCLILLSEIAVRRDAAGELVRALTGRPVDRLPPLLQ